MRDAQPEISLRKLADSPNNRCFACGLNNPIGLHLRFEKVDGVVRTHFVPGEWHEGWQGLVHGGIISTLLDEAMAFVLFFEGVQAVTVRMEARFRARVDQGDALDIEARLVKDSRKLADVEGRVLRGGAVVAEATARFMKVGRLSQDSL